MLDGRRLVELKPQRVRIVVRVLGEGGEEAVSVVVEGGGDAVVDVALRILLALRRTNGFAVEDVEAE